MSTTSISRIAASLLGGSTEPPRNFPRTYADVSGKRFSIDFSNSSRSVDAGKPFYLVRNDRQTPGVAQYYALPTWENRPAAAEDPAYDHPVYHSQPGDSWRYVIDGTNVAATLVGTFRMREYVVDHESGKPGRVLGQDANA